MMVYPLVKLGIIGDDYPVAVSALSGYSGAGKKAIAMYESPDKSNDLFAPRQYALAQQHKHLKEMKAVCGLKRAPLFTPVVDDYYSGMLVSFPIYADLMKKKMTPGRDSHKGNAFWQRGGTVGILCSQCIFGTG